MNIWYLQMLSVEVDFLICQIWENCLSRKTHLAKKFIPDKLRQITCENFFPFIHLFLKCIKIDCSLVASHIISQDKQRVNPCNLGGADDQPMINHVDFFGSQVQENLPWATVQTEVSICRFDINSWWGKRWRWIVQLFVHSTSPDTASSKNRSS